MWAFRSREDVQAAWPTPGTEYSLLFLDTEKSEGIEADKLRGGEFARNNQKNLDVLDELGDVAMMAATALGPDWDRNAGGVEDIIADIPEAVGFWFRLAKLYGEAVWMYAQGNEDWVGFVIIIMALVSEYPGMDMPARVQQRLDRIERNHVLPKQASAVAAPADVWPDEQD